METLSQNNIKHFKDLNNILNQPIKYSEKIEFDDSLIQRGSIENVIHALNEFKNGKDLYIVMSDIKTIDNSDMYDVLFFIVVDDKEIINKILIITDFKHHYEYYYNTRIKLYKIIFNRGREYNKLPSDLFTLNDKYIHTTAYYAKFKKGKMKDAFREIVDYKINLLQMEIINNV